MPKAGSDNSTSPPDDPSQSGKAVANPSTTPPNEPSGDQPASQQEKRMRKTATAKSVHALQPMQQPTTQRRSIRAARGSGSTVDDPIIQVLDEYRSVMVQILQERGTNYKDPSDATMERECKVLQQITETVPHTLYGAMHLAVFIRNTIQDEIVITEYQCKLQDNLVRALERISGRPAPKVAPYLY